MTRKEIVYAVLIAIAGLGLATIFIVGIADMVDAGEILRKEIKADGYTIFTSCVESDPDSVPINARSQMV